MKDKENAKRSQRAGGQGSITCGGTKIKITSNFSAETMQAKKRVEKNT